MTEEAVDILSAAIERQAEALESLVRMSSRKGIEDCIDDQTEKLTEQLQDLVKASVNRTINVDVPAATVNLPAPVVHVPQPLITVEATESPRPVRYHHTVMRDSYGLITSIETVVVY